MKAKILIRTDHKLKIGLLAIFCLFFNAVCLAQAQYYPAPSPINPDKLPQTLFKLKRSHQPAERVKLLLTLSNIYFNKPFSLKANLDLAIYYAKEAAALSTKINDTAGYNDAELYIADSYIDKHDPAAAETVLKVVNDTSKINLLLALEEYYLFADKTDKRKWMDKIEKCALEAERLSRLYHQDKKEIEAQSNIAVAHLMLGNYTLADKEIKEVIRKYKAIGYQKLDHQLLILAVLNMSNGNYDKALYYGFEAEKNMKKTRDSIVAGDIYITIAFIYKLNNQLQKALDYSNIAINTLSRRSTSASVYTAILLSADCMSKLGHLNDAVNFVKTNLHKYPTENLGEKTALIQTLGNLYKAQKKYSLAIKYYKEGLDIERKDNTQGLTTLFDLGDTYVQQHQFELARPYLVHALESKDFRINMDAEKSIHYDIFLCDSAAGNYRSAMNQLNTVRKLEEYINEKVKLKESERLQIQYETNLKESEIKIKDQNIKLLSQKNQIQQASLTRETVLKNVTLGGIIILFVAVALTYIQYRRKLKLNGIITGQNQLITEKNAMLEHLLVEKDWLLKEVHHRVKNNLHTVICLLELQAAYLENDALKAIEDGQHRIYAMSLIHQKLYQSDDIKTIDMSAYIPELVQSLEESFDTSNQIKFKLNIDPISLTLSHAVPLGLIINEAVTNSIKYAFPGGRKGEISISIIDDGEQIKLELADNGIGMPLSNYETGQGSFGLRLMKGLSEDIKADISFEVDNGTSILIIFKRDALSDQESFLNAPVTKEMPV